MRRFVAAATIGATNAYLLVSSGDDATAFTTLDFTAANVTGTNVFSSIMMFCVVLFIFIVCRRYCHLCHRRRALKYFRTPIAVTRMHDAKHNGMNVYERS